MAEQQESAKLERKKLSGDHLVVETAATEANKVCKGEEDGGGKGEGEGQNLGEGVREGSREGERAGRRVGEQESVREGGNKSRRAVGSSTDTQTFFDKRTLYVSLPPYSHAT